MKNAKTQRSVLITGGTGSIGMELVKTFSLVGYKITFQYIHQEDTAKKLAHDYKATAWHADFSGNFKLPEADFGIVINCAAVMLDKVLLHELTNEQWQQALAVNLTAPFKICQQYLPAMVKQEWGRIINIGSTWSLRGSPFNSYYNVTKHGLSGLTKSITKEYAEFGITANEICPGPVESEIMHQVANKMAKRKGITPEAYLAEIEAKIPSGKRTTPEDIAGLALFLASDEAQAINGVSIPIDGGQIS